MKAIFFFLLSLFYFQKIAAQKAVVANLKMNIVEVGVINPLEILVENYKCSELEVTTSNGSISKGDSICSYNYIPERQGLAQIIISKIKGGVISRIDFRAKFIQEPYPTLCGETSGMLNIEILFRCPQIDAQVKGFDWDAGFRIQTYSLVIIRKGDTVFVRNREIGNVFSDEIRQEFTKNIGHGDKLIFYGITALGRDKRLHELSSMEFTIIEE